MLYGETYVSAPYSRIFLRTTFLRFFLAYIHYLIHCPLLLCSAPARPFHAGLHSHLQELLGTYMKRLIVNKPEEPLKFLLKTIQEDPYVVANATPMAPPVPTAEEEAAADINTTTATQAEAAGSL